MIAHRSKLHAHVAEQYLVWALEEIEKAGHQSAADYTRMALKALRGDLRRPDKSDDHS